MRLFLALVLGLVGSGLAGSFVAAVLSEWAGADQGYILVFFTLPIIVIVAVIAFAIAWANAAPRRAINVAAVVLTILVGLIFAVLGAIALGSGLDGAKIWREMQLVMTIGASSLAVVVVQWLIFRWLSAQKPQAGLPDPLNGGEAALAAAAPSKDKRST